MATDSEAVKKVVRSGGPVLCPDPGPGKTRTAEADLPAVC